MDTHFNENTYLHKGVKSIEMVTLKDKQDSFVKLRALIKSIMLPLRVLTHGK